ncbi:MULTISPECIES: hypothetical protein [Metabacillus]|uniref:hypothetical protein n=1 Tax=Metabacillus TaxID=2675233 RepID=UPI000AFABD0E|nr:MULTISPECIES: hypothetical protein [Metabacillus]
MRLRWIDDKKERTVFWSSRIGSIKTFSKHAEISARGEVYSRKTGSSLPVFMCGVIPFF